MITILLADDHHIVRQGLRSLLEAEPNFNIVGEAADGLEAARLAESLQPDVLVLDIMMPGFSGLEVTRQVQQRAPDTKVIILSMYADESYVLEALRNGAFGYVLKKSTADELARAIRQVIEGQRYLSPPLTESAIEAYMQKASQTTEDSYELLTTREREVLHLAAEGLTNVEIADRLVVSPRTVESHRANLMQKLGLRNQTDLVRYAIRRGILPLNDNA